MTGIPSSGKTTRTLELQKYFSDRGKIVHIVSETEQIAKAGFSKNSFYLGMYAPIVSICKEFTVNFRFYKGKTC